MMVVSSWKHKYIASTLFIVYKYIREKSYIAMEDLLS